MNTEPGFFLEMSFGGGRGGRGGIAFVGRENVKKHPGGRLNLLVFGGEIYHPPLPPKGRENYPVGPEKNTVHSKSS